MASFLKILTSACTIIGAFVILCIIFSLFPFWLDILLCTVGIVVTAIFMYLKSDYRKKKKLMSSYDPDDESLTSNRYESMKELILNSESKPVFLGRFFKPVEEAYVIKHGTFKSEDDIKLPLDVRTIVRHEAGHAIVARECGFLVANIYVDGDNECGRVSAHFDPDSTDTPQEMQFKAALIRCAGLLAEDKSTTSIVGHMSDFTDANSLILGLTVTTDRTFQEISDNIRDVVRNILHCHEEAHEKLVAHLLKEHERHCDSFELRPRDIVDIIGPQVGEIVFDENMVARYVMP